MSVGGEAKKSSQKGSSSGSFTNSSTPIAPEWIQTGDMELGGRAMALGNADPQSYFAPANEMQLNASRGMGSLNGYEAQKQFGDATALTGQIGARSSDYTNPYRDQVLNAATADWDHAAGATRAGLDLDLARNGAFGGSGAAIAKQQTEGELARGRNSAVAGLLNTMFDKQSQYGLQSDQLKLGAANQLGSLRTMYDDNFRSNATSQFDMGELLRQIQEQGMQAPAKVLEQVINMRNQIGSDKYFGEYGAGTEVGSSKGSGTSFGANASYSMKGQGGRDG